MPDTSSGCTGWVLTTCEAAGDTVRVVIVVMVTLLVVLAMVTLLVLFVSSGGDTVGDTVSEGCW